MSGSLMAIHLHRRAEEQRTRKEVNRMKMRTLTFDVKGQELIKTGNFEKIVAGTKGYLRAYFVFWGNDWRGCNIAASFWYKGVEYAALLDDNNSCVIPAEALVGDRFEVSLTGAAKNGNLIKSTKVIVNQEVI